MFEPRKFNYDWRDDPLVPEPEIIEGPPPKKELKPDDVSDFKHQRIIEMPHEFPYLEGKYRPPTLPYRSGYLPMNTYLEAGKLYRWCSCGSTWNEPWCDHKCHYNMTRCRPIEFNVNKSAYYKLCNCKQSSNAPFCNGTHKTLVLYHSHSHFNRWRIGGGIAAGLYTAFIWWNFYS
jgi:CDGSH-type Zn-finger protein